MAHKNTTPEKLIESEKVVERYLTEQIKQRGGMSIKLITTFISGLPDRLVLLPNKTIFFVETKTTKKNADKMQIRVHRIITSLGFNVYVLDTKAKVLQTLKTEFDETVPRPN